MTAISTAAVDRTTHRGTRLCTAITVLLWTMLAVNVAYVVGLVVAGTSPVVGVGLSLATQWVPVSVFWLVAVRGRSPRLPVVLAALAVTFSAAGDTYYSVAMDADGLLAFPSPADAGYLVFYPLLTVALVALVRPQLRGMGRLVAIETAVATMGAAAVGAVVLSPVIRAALADDSVVSAVIATAYPVFDLLVLAVLVGVSSVPLIRLGRRWFGLVAGLGVFTVADVVYALMAREGTYLAGTPLDAAWTIGLALMTWWVSGVLPSENDPPRRARRGFVVTLPSIAAIAGLTVLVVGTATPLPVFSIALSAVTVGLAAVPIIFRQTMLGRMLAAQDTAMERLQELDQQKTDILATVNHEFRTPLTSITGHAELLLDGGAGELPPAAIEMLRTIERNGGRLQGLIDETFAASRFDGEPVLSRSPIVISELITRAVASASALAPPRSPEISALAVDPELVVDADGEQLELALVALLDNAMKFTDHAGTVTLSAERAGSEIVITVSDSGIGIPVDDVARVFARFFRASNAKNAAISGVGLGLNIAGRIVAAHGGTIDVDSQVGRGTVMKVRLPAAPSSGQVTRLPWIARTKK